jgi:CrcB protein
MAALLVFLGAGLGGVARYGVNQLAVAWLGLAFPFGTLAVNVIGSFLMGLLAEVIADRLGGWPEARLFLMTGVLGGFTTFSAFSLDAYALWARGEGGLAAFYVVASVGLSIGALIGGVALARAVG